MVDIILATYNGEKFLESQLYSLLSQTYKDWKCYIHDDGSTDNTKKIIEAFCNLDSRFIFLDDNIFLHNASKNFLHGVKSSSSDFCCFCDQDDVWFDNKLEFLVSEIEKKNNTIPQVIFSNAYLWKSDTNSVYGRATLAYPKTCQDLLYLNCGIQGAAAIFNKKMVDILKNDLPVMCMHDYYLTLAGTLLGEIDYFDMNLMLYRQHGNNVTGNASGTMKSKYKTLFRRKNPLVNKNHLESLKCFVEHWNDYLKKDDLDLIYAFIKTENQNAFGRLYFINKYNMNIYGSKIKLIIKFFLRNYI